jgi:protein PhnA
MAIEQDLHARADSKCELCGATDALSAYEIPACADEAVLVCDTCKGQIEQPDTIDVHHWRCLNDSMWNTEPAVQIVAWRMLSRLSASGEGWAQDQLDMLYLEDDVLAKAKAASTPAQGSDIPDIKHIDSNGVVIEAGDTVVLIKDLNVKGTSFVAKRGTAVRNISLVQDNAEHIEGRVNGQQIVILTKFVKKS